MQGLTEIKMFSQLVKTFEKKIQEKADYSILSRIIYHKSEISNEKKQNKYNVICKSNLSKKDMINVLNNNILF